MWSRLARIPDWLLVGVLLLVHVGLLAWNARRESPTFDEPGHLVAGLSYWSTGQFDLYNVNPPLARLVAAGPVMLMVPRLDGIDFSQLPAGRVEFDWGRSLIAANGVRFFSMLTAARCAGIAFSILGALVCYRWARLLSGRAAGLLALALWCFFPEILGHGSLMTPDVPAAATGIWAGYMYWKWLRERTVTNAVIAGLVLGAALLTKTTWIILFVLWPLLWLVLRMVQRRAPGNRRWWSEAGLLGASLGVALIVVNSGYLFQGSFQRLGDYGFVSQALSGSDSPQLDPEPDNRFRGTCLGAVPVPLPAPMVAGIDLQKQSFENYTPAYVRGHYYRHGLWYLYLYAAVVKWPLGFWLLLWFRAIRRVEGESPVDTVALLGPAGALLIVVSMTGSAGYVRYLLPVLPFLFVWCAQLAEPAAARSWRFWAPVAVAAGWLVVSSIRVYPHSLAYFNEFAGGPDNGPAHLIDCNIDWGQDLFELQDWAERHPEAKPLYVAYYGQVDPRLAGIDARFPAPERPERDADGNPRLPPGYYAVSVHVLHGGPACMFDEQGRYSERQHPEYLSFLFMKPIAKAGATIYVYHVTGP